MTQIAAHSNALAEPIRMVLYCPRCQFQHVDAPDENTGWTNPPHLSHRCTKCKLVWRPADVPTRGVMLLETRGPNDADPLTIAVAHAAREQQVKDPSGLTPLEQATQHKIDAVEAQLGGVQRDLEQARSACNEGYAVVRTMAEEMDILDTPKVQSTLGNLSAGRLVSTGVLPFQCENARALNIASAARAEHASLTRQLHARPQRPAPTLSQPSSWLNGLNAPLPTLTPRTITRGLLFVLIGFICMMMLSAFFSFWERVASF